MLIMSGGIIFLMVLFSLLYFFVITVLLYDLKKINKCYFKITLSREPRIIPGSPHNFVWNEKSCRVTSVDREHL